MPTRIDVPDDHVVVSLKVFERLKESENKLVCLENGGVDNWEGYDDAMEDFRTERDY